MHVLSDLGQEEGEWQWRKAQLQKRRRVVKPITIMWKVLGNGREWLLIPAVVDRNGKKG